MHAAHFASQRAGVGACSCVPGTDCGSGPRTPFDSHAPKQTPVHTAPPGRLLPVIDKAWLYDRLHAPGPLIVRISATLVSLSPDPVTFEKL